MQLAPAPTVEWRLGVHQKQISMNIILQMCEWLGFVCCWCHWKRGRDSRRDVDAVGANSQLAPRVPEWVETPERTHWGEAALMMPLN